MTNTTRFASLLGLGLALVACGGDGRPSPDAPAPGASRAVVVAGDFTEGHPGILTTLDLETREVRSNAGPAMAVGNDPVLRHIGDELLIVNRGENNITILDDETLALKEQLGTGENSNPQDVAVLGAKLYVATYRGNGLLVLTRGSTAVAQIALPADDLDGEPNCNSVYLVDTRLFVSCELHDSFVPRGPGKVYIVDTANDTVRTDLTVTLARQNPFDLFERIPPGAPNAGDLVISSVGNFTAEAGCIERVTTGARPTAAGCVVEGKALGGFASRIAFGVDGGLQMMWVAVSVPTLPPAAPIGQLLGFDLAGATLWPSITPSTQVIADAVQCASGPVVVIDSTKNANGMRVYESSVELTSAAMPIGLGSFSSHGLACY